LATTMDLLPTIAKLAKADLPSDRVYDGTDIMPLLTGQQKEVRDLVYYYFRTDLHAIRMGPWKAHFITRPSYSPDPAVTHKVPLLFNINEDPSEKYDVSGEHPQIVEAIMREREKHMASLVPVPSQMDAVID